MRLLKYLAVSLIGLAATFANSVTSAVTAVVATEKLPVVLMHGILSDTTKITPVADWLAENAGVEVIKIEIGNGKKDSIEWPMPQQLEDFCQQIKNGPHTQKLKAKGFNLIGISQGGLLARGFVQKCDDVGLVRNLITWVSPHGGVYSYPILDIYTPEAQAKNSYPGYWRDPYQYSKYLEYSAYLADLNTENYQANVTQYKARITALSNLVLIWSPLDDVLDPPESGKFGSFDIGVWPPRVIPVEESLIWPSLGLDWLNITNRLHIYQTDCDHADHVTLDCLEAWKHYTLPFLN